MYKRQVIGCRLYEDEKYSTFEQRVLNKRTLISEIEKHLKDKEADVLCEELDKLGIPVASINQLNEIHEDPQVIEQGSLIEVEHPLAGKMRMPKPPFNFLNQNDFPKSHAPELGQHNREVLSELGVEEKELARMEERERANKKIIEGMMLADVANASRE